ncbi:aromatic ring-opening dioxygenase subunit LigA [Pararobbsia silviterrae]|uniref:Aromatic ring-opening dioxygenase subunit LigA n=1 Tax=Pararobbsia silviterrae TaxID=1792498 RepID=A0A494YCF4_9BURK|nr:aromatic ring-opening dioxygenase subunit LigA [Pararobbsia silviterrae]RKP57674.1 aromatic ring-opening dioxygenase subunit LigA [Pararobbsia silviterrae]
MSLYQLQKVFYDINREPALQRTAREDLGAMLERYDLTDEERAALLRRDIGLLYVLGVNCQLLMHFAALCEVGWSDYLEQMREGVRRYGPVRAGVYAMTTRVDEKVAGL